MRRNHNPARESEGIFGTFDEPCAPPADVNSILENLSLVKRFPVATGKVFFAGKRLSNFAETQASASCSPPIQAAKKKMRAAVDVAGVRAGTPDAEALCRGDLKGANIWDYFKSTGTESAQGPQRPSSAPRPLSARTKSVCVAGGCRRPSAVRRNLCPRSISPLDDVDLDDSSCPSSPLIGIHPWQIKVVSGSSEEEDSNHGMRLPPIVSKDLMPDSGVKLTHPALKILGDTPRSRRPSMDSVSTAPSESDNKF